MERSLVSICGSGRTGTHWLGSSFGVSDYRIVGETHPGFEQSVRCAVGADDPARLVKAYRDSVRKRAGNLLFKWHPSLWVVPELLAAIPELRFVATRRTVLGTTKSMFRHNGTRRWAEEHENYTCPSGVGFMGTALAEKLEIDFAKATVPVRCALRVAAHMVKVAELRHLYPEQVFVFDYDTAAVDVRIAWRELSQWLGHEVKPRKARTREHPDFDAEDTAAIETMALKCAWMVSMQHGQGNRPEAD